MINTSAKSKSLLLAAIVVGLVNVPSSSAGAKSWKDETVDLNGPNMGITTERAIGERPNEIIDLER